MNLPSFSKAQIKRANSLTRGAVASKCFGKFNRFCAKLTATETLGALIVIFDAETPDVYGNPSQVASLPLETKTWNKEG